MNMPLFSLLTFGMIFANRNLQIIGGDQYAM